MINETIIFTNRNRSHVTIIHLAVEMRYQRTGNGLNEKLQQF
jgi:hypothetical protein